MSTAASSAQHTSTGPALAPFAVAGVALSTVFTAIGTFQGDDPHAWRQMVVVFGIILVTAAAAFWAARRPLAGADTDRLVRTGTVLAILAVLSLGAFWACLPPVLAAAATAVALEARSRRGGVWGRGPATTIALSAVTVVLAGVAAVVG